MRPGQKTFRRSRPTRHEKVAKGRPGYAVLPQESVIYGLHAVEAALQNPKRVIRHAYLTENAAAKLAPMISARGIVATVQSPQDFEGLVGASAVHQGAVLLAEPLRQPSLDEFLDELEDEARHSPPLSGTLAKVASGAVEEVAVIATVNLARALERLKDHGFRCAGFDSEAQALFDARTEAAPRVTFVFGAEDRGLRRLIREGCDALYALFVPGKIKSLNISNAAAIVFHEAAKARRAS
jgi:23S rRNA (guanosine2251-2'-O)-methyltransferase